MAALKNRAIEPQAVVALAEQRTSLVSVLGDVNASTRFPASAEGERVLDAITRAGGPKSQGFDEWVMLERGGRRATAPFGALVYEPSNNVWVHPNDTIYLYREPQTFVAFGAFGGSVGGTGSGAAQGLFNFEAWRLSLAEAVANGRPIATEYEQLVNTEEWRHSWRQVGYRVKRCDGLTSRVGPIHNKRGAILLDIEIIEMFRTCPRESMTRNAEGALVVQDEMGRLLMSLRQHSANGQRVTILLVDDRLGHGIAGTIVRFANERGIQISPQFVQFVFVSMRPGKPIFGPFHRAPLPGCTPAAIASSV